MYGTIGKTVKNFGAAEVELSSKHVRGAIANLDISLIAVTAGPKCEWPKKIWCLPKKPVDSNISSVPHRPSNFFQF